MFVLKVKRPTYQITTLLFSGLVFDAQYRESQNEQPSTVMEQPGTTQETERERDAGEGSQNAEVNSYRK